MTLLGLRSTKTSRELQNSINSSMGIITESVNRHILLEANTSGATNTEMAICFHYNLLKTKGDEVEAKKLAGIDDKNFAKLTPELLEIGEKVAKQMGNRGSKLIHSGAMKGGSNFYEGATDTTPKADFFGNTVNRISLKQAGDSGSGAQLMSAKSAEATGVFESAVRHYEAAGGGDLTKSKEFKSALDILEVGLLESAKNDMVVQAGSSQKEFINWYTSESSRYKELVRKHKQNKVVDHLKAELNILGIGTFNKNSYKKLLPGVPNLERDGDLKKYQKEFEKNATVEFGDVQVSAKHIKNVSSDKLTAAAIKSQIAGVVDRVVNGARFKVELQRYFDNNQDLKKWVVYEAGSGLYKFTGEYSNGSDYTGGNDRVANKILVFNKNGISSEYSMMKYASDNYNLCDNINVNFKASGKSSYLALRISSAVEHELPMLQEELNSLKAELLTEGFIKDMSKKFMNFVDKAKQSIFKFIEKIIKYIIGNIKTVAQKGITAFNEAMGFEMKGNVKLKTPSW